MDKTVTRREYQIVALLSVLAAIHVFIFSATFPFFSIVDEQSHIDLAIRYSQGEIPRTLGAFSEESLPYLVVYDSLEYLQPVPPGLPAWKQPMENVRAELLTKETFYHEHAKNHEASQPPLYYAIAGGWWRIGGWLHLDGLGRLYWLRFFNILLVAALVWLGWWAARTLFPENTLIGLGVPALIALMPQTIFYSVSNDIFSPLTFGTAFVLLLKFWTADAPSRRLAGLTGLALAATFLAKLSNLPLLVIATFFIAVKLWHLWRDKKLKPLISTGIWLALSAGLPVAAWMIWCKINFGDFTGSAAKTQLLGWTDQPPTEWFHHPLFTLQGFWFFIRENLATFWQGELIWHGRPLAFPSVDLIYVLLTLGLLASTFLLLLCSPDRFSARQRPALWLAFTSIAASFAFYAFLSVKYDFHNCFKPSRAVPFFTAGRMLLGLLIPLLILFVCGVDLALRKFNIKAKFSVLSVFLIFMLLAEIAIDWQVFPNVGNWFHM